MAQCSECRFYKTRAAELGDCLRYPPTMQQRGINSVVGEWPIVSSKAWCGDYETVDPKEKP